MHTCTAALYAVYITQVFGMFLCSNRGHPAAVPLAFIFHTTRHNMPMRMDSKAPATSEFTRFLRQRLCCILVSLSVHGRRNIAFY